MVRKTFKRMDGWCESIGILTLPPSLKVAEKTVPGCPL